MSTDTERTLGRRDEPLGEVARDLTRDLSLLVRQEVQLAKAEMAEKGRIAAPGVGMIGGATVAAFLAGGALTAAAILGLAIFLPEWLAALIVGAVLAVAAYVLVQARQRARGRGRRAHARTDHRNREGGRRMGQDPSQLREELEETRSRVGEEVDAISYKTDVGARVGDYVSDKKDAVTSKLTG